MPMISFLRSRIAEWRFRRAFAETLKPVEANRAKSSTRAYGRALKAQQQAVRAALEAGRR